MSLSIHVHSTNGAVVVALAGTADASMLQRLQEVALKDGSFEVRAATASALGRLDLSRDVRVELMRSLLGR